MNPWFQIALSLGVGLLTSAGALVGVRLSMRGNDRPTGQREFAARREEWWRRFTWAAEPALDDSPAKRVAGLNLLTALAKSELAERDECLLLDEFQKRALDSPPADEEPAASDVGMTAGHVTAEHVAAARLRLVLDAKLGRTTPDRVRRTTAMAGVVAPVASNDLDRLAARKWFEDQVTPEVLAQIGASGRTAWLLAIDVDGLKDLNAVVGHEAGDAALREIGELLAREAGASGLVARTGGDEFVVLFTAGSDEPDAGGEVAERMRVAVAEHDWRQALGTDHRPRISVGVVAVRPEEQLQEARFRADRSLYVAKRRGGDQVWSDVDEAKSRARQEDRL